MVDVEGAQFDWKEYFAEYYKHDLKRKKTANEAFVRRRSPINCLLNFLERDIEILENVIHVMSMPEYSSRIPISASEINLLRVLQAFILERYPAYLQTITDRAQKALILEAMINSSFLKENWDNIFGYLEGRFATSVVLPATLLPERVVFIHETLPKNLQNSTFPQRFQSFYFEYRNMCEKASSEVDF